jgi:UDP-glucose 4-epimerase
MSERWLVTGGAGYIGAHVVRALLASGREPVVVDDLSTGHRSRVPEAVDCIEASVLDTDALVGLLTRLRPTGILHIAGKKSPTESMSNPLLYARENAGAVTSVATAAVETGVRRIVFSSSCSVYGTPDVDSVGEDHRLEPVSPYGESKVYGEQVLRAAAASYGLGAISLRYFNVIGAQSPELRDTGAHNLVPLVFRAIRDHAAPQVFGADYDTPDGTCVRDYLDVRDLADAHVCAADALESDLRGGTYNVGRGTGSSVLEVLDTIRSVTGLPIPHEVVTRRPGDPARIVGRVERIAAELAWRATRDLRTSVRDAWAADQAAHRPSPDDTAAGAPARAGVA